jgi:hypothetical protein
VARIGIGGICGICERFNLTKGGRRKYFGAICPASWNYFFGFWQKSPNYIFGFWQKMANYLFGFWKIAIFVLNKSVSCNVL